MKPIYRIAFAGLIVIAAASLLLNLHLLRASRAYDRLLSDLRLDPLDLSTDFLPSAPATATTSTVLFYGDSRAAAWDLPALPPDYHVVNRGIGGQTSAQVNLRFPHHAAPIAADVIVLQVGVNDLITIPFFAHRQPEIIAATQANIQQIINTARAQGAQVILTTIFPLSPGSDPFFAADAIHVSILEVNDYIRSLNDVILFDTFELLVGENGRVRGDFAADELHINSAGYAHLNTALVPLLERVSAGEPYNQ